MAALVKVVFALVLLGSIGSKSVYGGFRFTKEPSNPSSFVKGTNATLVWDYSVDNQQTELEGIIWSVLVGSSFVGILVKNADTNAVQHHPDIPSTYNGRVDIKGRATLVIVNITLQDRTSFRCRLSAKAGSGLSEVDNIVTLFVTDPARASLLEQVIDVEDVGDTATFTCNATGIPTPTFTWMRRLENNETVVVSSNSKYEIISGSGTSSLLKIKSITVEDYGYYECKATGLGFDVADGFLGVPHLNARKGSALLSSTKGHLVTLDCPVIGFPPPEVTWTLPNGSVLSNRLILTLPVILKTDADFGNYTCNATSLDRTFPRFTINIQDSVLPLKSEVKSGTPAVVNWDPVSNAKYYLVKMTGDSIEDDVGIASGNQVSIEIHFNTLVLKGNKKVKEVQITVQVLALSRDDIVSARGERLPATVSASVALQASVLYLCVVLVQMLSV